AIDGELDNAEFVEEDFFGVQIPTSVPGVPDEVLDPQSSWDDKAAYADRAKQLAGMFRENFKQFEDRASEGVLAGGPKA
ncbi:MAG: phosphoenolpyruvate carboxykinase (ATP), partial [Chloroflexota bacterium]